ncbi:LysM peptidoglycan-binding domain-containing protein [Cerasicoccus maritimus]|uniref:LysM peptidoglycan-binding domain-containing protein n=1 Tax=Cerasicoccus maritimus TaxID=490089 RepID=UPI002852B611|nr:LysM peptidoglycan-binding domain-containing protein [Cerasicoccus maritimus]
MSELLSKSAITRRRFLALACSAGACIAAPTLWGAPASPLKYEIKSGDTLSEIAQNYGVTVSQLKRANRLTSDRIFAGQTLTIPGAVSSNVLAPVIQATRNLKINRSRWRYIVAHHSAIEQGNAAIYGAAHKRRGMENGLAYHFVIGNGIDSGDGEIEVGPRWRQQLRGGHVRDSRVNDVGIGICLVGNFENHAPTARQRASLIQLVNYLRDNCVDPRFTFTVHKWVDGANHTVCPGKHFPYREMSALYRA